MGLDVVYMPSCEGCKFLVVTYCDLFSCVEAKPLCTLFLQTVANFLWNDIICRYGCFEKLIIDKVPKNKDVVAELAQKYEVKRVVVLIYHPQTNEIIKRGHKLIVAFFQKY